MGGILGFLSAIFFGGIAGLVGAVILIRRQTRRLQQRLLKQVKQEVERQLQQPASFALRQDIDRLQKTQNQLKQEIATLRKQVKHLQTQLQASQASPLFAPSSSASPLSSTTSVDAPPNPIAKLEPKTEPVEVEQAIAWLSTHQVSLESYYQPAPDIDAIFNPLAVYLGNRFPLLAALYKQMKRDVATGRQFRFSLKDKTQDEVAVCTQFCKKLSNLSLLSFYKYSRNEKLIQAALQNRTDVIKFFHGEWFERFVYCEVTQLLNSYKLNYECLINPKVTFANGNRFELDLFFLIEQQPLWIECKTGKDYDSYLERYSNHRRTLGIPKSRSLLVILDMPESQTAARTHLWDITVVSRDSFLQFVNTALETPEALNTQPERSSASPPIKKTKDLTIGQPVSHPVSAEDPCSVPPTSSLSSSASLNFPAGSITPAISPEAKLIASFNKTDLHPVPEYRAAIIQYLIQTLQTASPPPNFKQLKDLLAELMQISKNKVQSVLKAVYRSHYFLGSNGQPVESYSEPIVSLRSVDPQQIEQQCLERYAAVALNNDRNYFDQPQNVECFERVVGSPPPSIYTLDRLKHEQHASPEPEEANEASED